MLTIPLKSVAGGKTFAYLTDDLEDRRSAEYEF